MEEAAATAPQSRLLGVAVALIAIAMSLYHMYVAGFGPPEAMIFRGTHLLFALTLVFLLYPSLRGGGAGWRALDLLLLVAGWGGVLNIFLNYDSFINRIIYIDELTRWDMIWGSACVLVVLEGRLACSSPLEHLDRDAPPEVARFLHDAGDGRDEGESAPSRDDSRDKREGEGCV